jgi:hypothetical protein
MNFSFLLAIASAVLVSVAAHSSPLDDGTDYDMFRQISQVDQPIHLDSVRPLLKDLASLDKFAPQRTQLKVQPWADGHWHMNSGLIAARYADSGFHSRNGWRDRRNYIDRNPLRQILKESNPAKRARSIDSLSPAEKYDLLVGDDQASLSDSLWIESERFLVNGTIKSWMGICEGSAAASVMYSEPKKSIILKSPSGVPIEFHVMDIKGLASLLWSNYNVPGPIAGSRCKTHTPRRDGNGVITDESCFDTNPATVHLAALNFLGVRHVPFFINRYKAVEVWNSPVIGYEVRYINLSTGRHAGNMSEALTPLSQVSDNKFSPYRSSQTASLLGVELILKVASGFTTERNRSSKLNVANMIYNYDLEIDSAGNVIGGEWRTDSHPDFIWQIDSKYVPSSAGDRSLGAAVKWDGSVVPASWIGAIRSSSRQSQPMEKIVSKLIELSQ